MTARKLVYYGLVVSPSLLLGFIGLGARAYKEPYEFDHFNKDQDACARTYIELIRAANALPPFVEKKQSIGAIRRIGQAWANAVTTSRAKTIPVLDIDQSTSWVVCEEVTAAKARVSWSLWRIAQNSIENREYDQAARDLATSYVVNQASKGMNLFTISQASKRQELVLNRLTEISPYLSSQVRDEIKELFTCVRRLDNDTSSKLKLVRAGLRMAYADTEIQGSDNKDNLAYWSRLYANSEKSVSNLEKKWKSFCASADSRVCLAGPMPKNLVYKHETKQPAITFSPFYAGRYLPHGYTVAYATIESR